MCASVAAGFPLSAERVCNHTVTSLLPHPDAQSKLINLVSALAGRVRNTLKLHFLSDYIGFIFVVFMSIQSGTINYMQDTFDD